MQIMKKMLIEEMYKNRLLNTTEELEKFEECLNKVAELIQEEDIVSLCKVFDDDTRDSEMMFGVIHLIEMFSSERAFELTVLGIANMKVSAPDWAKIITYRCLNDDFSRNMLKKTIRVVEPQVQQAVISLLNTIKIEDFDKFGMKVDEVLS